MIAAGTKPLHGHRGPAAQVAGVFHTMTRTARSPGLLAAAGKRTLTVHPLDASKAHLEDGVQAQIVSRVSSYQGATGRR